MYLSNAVAHYRLIISCVLYYLTREGNFCHKYLKAAKQRVWPSRDLIYLRSQRFKVVLPEVWVYAFTILVYVVTKWTSLQVDVENACEDVCGLFYGVTLLESGWYAYVVVLSALRALVASYCHDRWPHLAISSIILSCVVGYFLESTTVGISYWHKQFSMRCVLVEVN